MSKLPVFAVAAMIVVIITIFSYELGFVSRDKSYGIQAQCDVESDESVVLSFEDEQGPTSVVFKPHGYYFRDRNGLQLKHWHSDVIRAWEFYPESGSRNTQWAVTDALSFAVDVDAECLEVLLRHPVMAWSNI